MSYRIGVDVGGTFTDFALFNDEDQGTEFLKLLTTPADPSQAVLDGVDQLTKLLGITAADVADIRHATTIATNTIIQRNGPKTALITTAGFRDLQIIGRQRRAEIYDTGVDRPTPVVRRKHTWEVSERMLFNGTVHKTLDEDAVYRIAAEMLDEGIESVGICFLHSYANPAHEQRVAEILRDAAPSIAITLSSAVSPVYREYERGSTTTLNAYVVPPVRRYVERLADGLRERGYRGELLIMQSNGGIATPEVVKKFPIRIVESGPAAGVLTAARYTKAAGSDNILSFDMGGTTAKVCLIENGKPSLTGQFEVHTVNLKPGSGLPIDIPAIDLVEIGSGGGSIARVDMGSIKVGPESASSVPGPICYGRGGQRPTVTDADLILGYIDPGYFLGGKMKLDRAAAAKGIEEQIGTPLGIGLDAAAWGIFEVVTAQMAEAARVVSVGHGKDPRMFAFIPFGGAGPVHGARIARMLGCPRIVFPSGAGVQSAVGLLMGDVRFDLARTLIVEVGDATMTQAEEIFALLVQEGRDQIAAGSLGGEIHFSRSAHMRFVGQGYEINVDLPDGELDPAAIRDAFFTAYGQTYGERTFSRSESVEFVKLQLSARVDLPKLTFPESALSGAGIEQALKRRRAVYFPETDGFTDCPVYDRYRLSNGDRFEGPALIEERESTIVVLPNSVAEVDGAGNIIVDLH